MWLDGVSRAAALEKLSAAKGRVADQGHGCVLMRFMHVLRMVRDVAGTQVQRPTLTLACASQLRRELLCWATDAPFCAAPSVADVLDGTHADLRHVCRNVLDDLFWVPQWQAVLLQQPQSVWLQLTLELESMMKRLPFVAAHCETLQLLFREIAVHVGPAAWCGFLAATWQVAWLDKTTRAGMDDGAGGGGGAAAAAATTSWLTARREAVDVAAALNDWVAALRTWVWARTTVFVPPCQGTLAAHEAADAATCTALMQARTNLLLLQLVVRGRIADLYETGFAVTFAQHACALLLATTAGTDWCWPTLTLDTYEALMRDCSGTPGCQERSVAQALWPEVCEWDAAFGGQVMDAMQRERRSSQKRNEK